MGRYRRALAPDAKVPTREEINEGVRKREIERYLRCMWVTAQNVAAVFGISEAVARALVDKGAARVTGNIFDRHGITEES